MTGQLKASKDQQYLIDRGWRLITSKRVQYGKIFYWYHDLHQREDGLWWTQGNAVMLQRGLERRAKVVGKKV